MSRSVPELIDPHRAVEQRTAICGCVPIAEMGRLVRLLAEGDLGEACFELSFGRDAGGLRAVNGQVEARLPLTCQRCLDVVLVKVQARFQLALVEGLDEAARLPEAYEPLLPEEDRVRIRDLVEDELILSLPQVARHERGACAGPLGNELEPEPGQALGEDEARGNPFAALADLKRQRDER